MTETTQKPRWMQRTLLGMAGGGLFVLTATAIAHLRDATKEIPPPPVSIAATVSDSTSSDVAAVHTETTDDGLDRSLEEQLIGTWHLERHGKRTLTVREDGTATADVRLDMIGALLYGERFQLELTWSLEDDVMSQQIVSGNPESSMKSLVRDWGDHREYRVLEVAPEQLVLAEVGDEDDRQVWTRVELETIADQSKKSPR